MRNTKLLLDVASDLQSLADSLRALAEDADTAELAEPQEPPVPSYPTVPLEQVRAVLADKSRAGKTAEVRGLLQRFGSNRLSAIDPGKYAPLLAAAEEL